MESKLVIFDQIKELPADGYCRISGEDSVFLQRTLFRMGYFWPGLHSRTVRNDTIILWWRFYKGEKVPIEKRMNKCSSFDQVSHLCDKVEFSDYFKPKPEYVGYIAGREFGI